MNKSSPKETVVVVGTALAGLRGIETLRREGYDGRIIAIGAEPHLPYDRPPLSKQFLKGDWEEDRLFLLRGDAPDLEVDWRLGSPARSLDLASREVVTDDERIAFDKLLLATGTVARQLPFGAEFAGIQLLRTLDDSRALRADLTSASRVLIVGAGFIGMEVAATCRQRGLDVTVVEPMEQPLLRGLGAELGSWVGDRQRDEGVEIRCGVGVQGFEGGSSGGSAGGTPGDVDGRPRVERVKLTDGTSMDADVVVVGVGARPATDWLTDSGLTLDDGIVCDGAGATNVPGIFAAGDVARWKGTRLEHWTSAVEQGVHAATRLLKGREAGELAHLPYVWTDQFELRLQIAGHVKPGDEQHVCHGSLDPAGDRRFIVLFGRDGRLVAAVGNKRPRQLIAIRKLMAAGASFQAAVAANP